MSKTIKTETAAKKDVRKLQRAIVDGLEKVKAVDVQVFDTESLSPLFERVIVASGNSNRQTRALAASVSEKVREAGFDKPRSEGEENAEWIIVDCGPVVAHIMQPAVRQYYHLEEIWGEKPVRMRHGADKVPARRITAAKVAVPKSASLPGAPAQPTEKRAAARTAASKAPVRKATAAPRTPAKAASGKTAPKKTTPKKTASTKAILAKTAGLKKAVRKATAPR